MITNFLSFFSELLPWLQVESLESQNIIFVVINKRLFSFAEGSTLRQKCPSPEMIWSVFPHIRIAYGEILRIALFSVWMQENTNQKNSK